VPRREQLLANLDQIQGGSSVEGRRRARPTRRRGEQLVHQGRGTRVAPFAFAQAGHPPACAECRGVCRLMAVGDGLDRHHQGGQPQRLDLGESAGARGADHELSGAVGLCHIEKRTDLGRDTGGGVSLHDGIDALGAALMQHSDRAPSCRDGSAERRANAVEKRAAERAARDKDMQRSGRVALRACKFGNLLADRMAHDPRFSPARKAMRLLLPHRANIGEAAKKPVGAARDDVRLEHDGDQSKRAGGEKRTGGDIAAKADDDFRARVRQYPARLPEPSIQSASSCAETGRRGGAEQRGGIDAVKGKSPVGQKARLKTAALPERNDAGAWAVFGVGFAHGDHGHDVPGGVASGEGDAAGKGRRPHMLSPVMANELPIRSLRGKRVLVLVQGELAQSPRMLNHARALCEEGAEVILVGYDLVPLPDDIASAPGISVRRISEVGAERLDSVPRIFYLPVAAARTVHASLRLAWRLTTMGPFEVAIMQNPPALPALPLALIASRARGARVIVDWHSRTAAMLGLRLGPGGAVVRLVNRLEGWLARRASSHLAVSNAMREDLRERFGIDAAVLHDRPRLKHAVLSAEQRIAVIRRALAARRAASAPDDAFVLVSPTSFSADEDMNMLLDALGLVARRPQTRPILLFATGYGPLRTRFEARARKIATSKLRIVTGWLPEPLYRDLLRAADLGISMHRSASGVDLPMKVVDMVEAGLPASVFDYGPCLAELVPPVLKPFMFTDAKSLAARLGELFDGTKLAELHAQMAGESGPLWADEWRRVALPLVAGDARQTVNE
jgi:beta-1,4-mannosyltransferase